MTAALNQQLAAATDRLEDELCLWRQKRVLEHRLRYSRLQFEHDFYAIDFDEQDRLFEDVGEWMRLVDAFAKSRGSA